MVRYFVFLTAVSLLSLPAMAADSVPVPSSHPVKKIENKLENEKARQARLQDRVKKLQSELKTTKSDLIGIAGKIKTSEQELMGLETRIANMEEEQLEIETRLGEDKGAIADLILALERMRRVPPEAILAKPGAPLETAQSAMLLQSILPKVYGRAERLREDLERLDTILTALKADKAQALAATRDLESKHTEMAALMKKRETLYSRTESDYKKQAEEVKKISAKAENLKDLVSRIEQHQEETRTSGKKSYSPVSTAALPSSGSAQFPVSGIIRIQYGQSDTIGADSKGLHIESREGALVVAPMGGIVQFAGTFKNYGQLIIIEHEKGYHSLVAGLDRIDTVVGQAVSAGEPVGLMGRSSGPDKPSLYYELRHKGQPVNPSRKFAGLG